MGGETTPTTGETSEAGRLAGIFFEPAATFQSIARRPSFLVPLVVLTLLSLGVTWWIGERVGWERVIRAQIEQNPRAREMPAEQREQAIEQWKRRAPMFAYVQGAVAITVLTLIVSGVMLFVFNVFGGSELEFRRVFSVASWSMMPLAVASLLALVIIALKEPQEVDVQNLVASNLGALFDAQRTPRPLLSLLGSLDLFTAWQIFLLSTGLAALAGKMTFGKALVRVLLVWVVWVGLKVAWAAIFS